MAQDPAFTDSRRLQSYSSAAEAAAGVTALGFGTDSEPYKAAIKYFAASPAPGRLLVSCCPEGEDWRTALDAVLDRTAAFYGVMICGTLTPDQWLALAQHVEAQPRPLRLFVPVTGTVGVTTWDAIATLYSDLRTGNAQRMGQYPGAPLGPDESEAMNNESVVG